MLQRKKIVLSITLALGLANNPAQAQLMGVLQLGDLDGTDGFRLDGAASGDNSGRAVSKAGDINGDGIGDLLIGAYYADPNGSSYVVFGKNTPFDATQNLSSLDGTNGFRLDGAASNDNLGRAVSGAGDINGDGIDDLLIGADFADPNGEGAAGSSYVVFGKSTPFVSTLDLNTLDGTNGFRIDGALNGDQSGFAVSTAGDVNGDGIDDLLIGAPGADPNGIISGSSYVVFGKDTPFNATLNLSSLDGSNGFRLDGELVNRSGTSVSTAGDVNGDGIGDLIIGAYLAENSAPNSGSSFVVFGKNTPFVPTMDLITLDGSDGFRLDGENSSDRSGFAVSTAGDVNGDGIDDLLIGAPSAEVNEPGSSYVVFGKDSPFNATMNLNILDGSNGFRLDGTAAGDHVGAAVSAAGDVNGDGIDDLLIGANRADPNGISEAGSSYVVFGKDAPFTPTINLSTLDGTNGFRFDGTAAGDRSGIAVSAAGDVNGDGIDDLLIGAPFADPNGNSSGSSYVVFGPLSLFPLIDFDQKLIDFGDTVLGTNSEISTLTLNNPGFGPLFIQAITQSNVAFNITGGDCGLPPIYIPENQSCMLDLQFTPQAVGTAFTSMTFVSNVVTSPDTITLAGNGVEPPAVSLQPDPLLFIDTPIANSSTQTLVVENIGASTLEPGTVSIQGTDMGVFSVTMNNCIGAQLALNQSCDIEVSFTPTAAGSREAMLQLDSNAPSSPDFVELQGSSDVIFKDGFE